MLISIFSIISFRFFVKFVSMYSHILIFSFAGTRRRRPQRVDGGARGAPSAGRCCAARSRAASSRAARRPPRKDSDGAGGAWGAAARWRRGLLACSGTPESENSDDPNAKICPFRILKEVPVVQALDRRTYRGMPETSWRPWTTSGAPSEFFDRHRGRG